MSYHRLQLLLPALALPLTGQVQVAAVTLDSRQVVVGSLFVARQGSQKNGQEFIDDALQRGASVIVQAGEKFEEKQQQGVAVITVPDLDAALLSIAESFYGISSREVSLIAVTGTNGKTSISAFVAQMLEACGVPCGVIGTLGARFGATQLAVGHTTPDIFTFHAALAALQRAGAEVVALEMSSHALHQKRLGAIRIHTAVFSNLSHDHLDYHGTMDNYQAAKERLFHDYGARFAVLATDGQVGRDILQRLPADVVPVTVAPQAADWRYDTVHYLPQGVQASIHRGAQSTLLSAPLYGAFNVQNVALAAAAASTVTDHFDSARAFAALRAIPGRMEPVLVESAAALPRVLVDFAHTPDGVEQALQASRAHFSGALWCVLGCGGNRDAAKRPVMAATAEQHADHLVITSDNPRDEAAETIAEQMLAGMKTPQAAVVELDRARAIEHTVAQAAAGDVLLLAGKGHEQYQEIAGVQYPFSDLAVAQAALLQRAGGAV